jgi:hypothetical protein
MPLSWFGEKAVLNTQKKEVFDSFFSMIENSLYGSLVLSAKVILLIVSIIFLMDFIKSTKIVQEYQQKVSASFSIIAGLILGITYGAGILINEAKSGALSKKEIFYIGTFLMICHSIIEDTLLFVIFGANYWILVLVRLVYAIIFSYILVKIFFKNENVLG